MLVNLEPISNLIGALLVFVGIVLLGCLPVSLILEDDQWLTFLWSSLITITVGGIMWSYNFASFTTVNKREGYIVVALGWFSVSIFCMLPYLISGSITSVHNAFFESVSGFTTTGATILQDIEAIAPSILLWRSITQWIGGMGIIVLTVALFPLLGIAGIELFSAEAPGPTSDRIHPRIRDTARTIWFVYVGLTAILFAILMVEGMGWFDAINHALTTMATGGFSTKNQSIAHFTSPLIQYTLIIFMILAGTNYTVLYLGLTRKFKKIYKNEEFRMYMILLVLFITFGTVSLRNTMGYDWEESFRAISFSVVSVITTTGYITYDYTMWGPAFLICFFILLFCGASAGSTSGGVKLIRHLVYMRNAILEFKRIIHPRAMIRLKVNKTIVSPRILTHILVFLLLYLFLFVMGAIILTMLGQDLITAIGASATSLGNVGPGIGSVGPVDNYAHLPVAGKYVLCFLMICGRLEIFTILILFSPYFWRDN